MIVVMEEFWFCETIGNLPSEVNLIFGSIQIIGYTQGRGIIKVSPFLDFLTLILMLLSEQDKAKITFFLFHQS
jgi:hypothetical protein